MSRIAPLSPPYAPQIQEQFDKVMRGAPPLVLFRVMAGQPRAWEKFRGGSLLDRGPLSLREREIVIDRTCALNRCEYEWGVHVAAFGDAAGFTPAQNRAIADPAADDSALTERDRLLVRMVDELHETANVSDGLWQQLAAQWSTEQLLELLLLAGWYHAISYVCNAARVPLEPWAARWQRPG